MREYINHRKRSHSVKYARIYSFYSVHVFTHFYTPSKFFFHTFVFINYKPAAAWYLINSLFIFMLLTDAKEQLH